MEKNCLSCFITTLGVSIPTPFILETESPLIFYLDRQVDTMFACQSLTWHVDSGPTVSHFCAPLPVFMKTCDKPQHAPSTSCQFMLIPALWFVVFCGVLWAHCTIRLASTVTTTRKWVRDLMKDIVTSDESSCREQEKNPSSKQNNEIIITSTKRAVRSQSTTVEHPGNR